MNKRLFGIFAFVAALPLCATLLGCSCGSLIITEEFENFCDGAPCSWEVTGGNVSQVPTYHADVLGVAIPSGVTIRALEDFGTRPVQVLVRCDEGATIQINDTTILARTELFEWQNVTEPGNTTITVRGTGQCVVDDVGYYDFCY